MTRLHRISCDCASHQKKDGREKEREKMGAMFIGYKRRKPSIHDCMGGDFEARQKIEKRGIAFLKSRPISLPKKCPTGWR